MKKKILDALKQGYKKLGLAEEAFERVAALGETFITSEEQISDFVKMSESLLKAEQSAADRVRTELNAKIKELEGEKSSLEAKLKDVKVEEVLEHISIFAFGNQFTFSRHFRKVSCRFILIEAVPTNNTTESNSLVLDIQHLQFSNLLVFVPVNCAVVEFPAKQ